MYKYNYFHIKDYNRIKRSNILYTVHNYEQYKFVLKVLY